jgi:hypothetical protein
MSTGIRARLAGFLRDATLDELAAARRVCGPSRLRRLLRHAIVARRRGRGHGVHGVAATAAVMRSRSRLLVFACAGALSGCGLFRGPAEARSLVLDLPVSRSEAVRRTLTAFREQGYTVRSSLTSGLNPETEPFKQGDAEAVFRAAISGSGSSSRVVLSGTYHTRELGGIVRSGEHEVRNSDDPIERALWSRLAQLRLTIRQ